MTDRERLSELGRLSLLMYLRGQCQRMANIPLSEREIQAILGPGRLKRTRGHLLGFPRGGKYGQQPRFTAKKL